MAMKAGSWGQWWGFKDSKELITHVWGEDGECGGFSTVKTPFTDTEPLTCSYELEDYGDDFEILGRPITLEDVLRAFKQKFKDARIEWDTYFYIYTGTDSALFTAWEFGKTLSDQEVETKLFLHSVLRQDSH